MTVPTALRSAARSDVGLVRASNQDSGYAGVRFLVVADGMGGHAGGDVASSIAVSELIALDEEAHGADAPEQLRRAVARAQRALLRRVDAEPALAGMGTTVTALLRTGDRLVLAHLGDSRGYLLRDGVLTQVTRDHTFVQRLVDDGRITAEEAERHPQRNVILRVLGDVQSSPEPDMSVRTAQLGDRWLLCSDGLPRVVSDATISETMIEQTDPATCADTLVQLALRAGAPDNVTCIVADVVDGDDGRVAVDPQVVGSAALHRTARTAAVESPAARAHALGRSHAEGASAPDGDDDEEGDPAGHPARRWPVRLLVLLVVVAVLAGGALSGSAWLRRQYYVGSAASGTGSARSDVAIYRGVSTQLGPVSLSRVVVREDLALADLPAFYRSQVEAGIPADSLADARRKVTSLRQAKADASPGSSPGHSTGPSPGASTSPSTPPSSGPGPTPAQPTPAVTG